MGKSYVPPAKLDEPMTGQTVGEVLESRDARFKPGDKVLTSARLAEPRRRARRRPRDDRCAAVRRRRIT
jgi:NADPH-dependent curcumin reductase CurA